MPIFLDIQGESIPDSQILGYGGTGVVLLHDGVGIRISFRNSRSSDARVRGNLKALHVEQDTYRRLCPSQDDH